MARLGVGRLAAWGAVSTTLALWTVLSAFRQRSNFYAAAVYLSKSNACMLILWNQALFHTVLFGKVLQAIFFGELRLIEVERLQERAWFAVTETLLALTIFREDFDSSFVVLFVSLLFLKVFHWLAADRVEAMEQAARVSRLAHARMIGLLCLLLAADAGFILNAADSIMIDGPTVMIMFASEYLILGATALCMVAKYTINCIDMRRETPWEEKSIWMFYVELTADFCKLVTYLIFFGLILTFYGLPLNILRDVYITLRSFILKVRDLRRYRQATRNMDELYPNATREEMDAMTDRTCIICREDMEFRPTPGEAGAPAAAPEAPAEQQQQRVGPNDTPKKLPCSHVFHFHCLRSWLERQQSCPTCRRPVLPQEQPPMQPPRGADAPVQPGAAAGAAGGPAAAEEAAMRHAQVNIARNLGREAFGTIFPGVPFPPEAEDPAARLPPPPSAAQALANAAAAPPVTPGPALGPPPPGAGGSPFPTSAPTPTATSPSAAAAAGAVDNPLARFALPSLPVPQTGEAGLYRRPPTFAYPPASSDASTGAGAYADLAYGAYPHFAGTAPHPPPPALPRGETRPGMNVEERVELLRRRWGSAESRVATDAILGEESAEGEAKKVDKGKGKAVDLEGEADAAVQGEEEEEAGLSPREAALRAAERRAGKTPAYAAASTSAAASSEERPLTRSSPSTETVVPAAPSAAAPAAPLPLPRLIPLFDPYNPSASLAAYPSLIPTVLDARPLFPPTASTAQLSEVEQLARRGVEERLRMLVGFQERIEGLVGEMQQALAGMPMGRGAGKEAAPAEESMQPEEGMLEKQEEAPEE